MNPELTIIICTYNRGLILKECLESLKNQTACSSKYSVLIIDNNSNDATKKIAYEIISKNQNFSYIMEEHQGLSHARNRGYKEAMTPWVSYVDDDAKAHSNYVERALWVIENYNFDCFGGMYYAWNKYGRPRWLPKHYGDKLKVQDDIGLMEEGSFASGGVIVFKKKVLEEIGGFDTNLGMNGSKISYGEETHLQIRMREQGYKIGFDPELQIDHLVAKYKLNFLWHLRSNFKQGETRWNTFNQSFTGFSLKFHFKNAFFALFREFIIKGKNINKSDYSLGNLFFDVLTQFFFRLGKLWGAYKKAKEKQ